METARNEKRAEGATMASRGLLARLRGSRSGATSIEYGLICSMIFLVIVASVRGVANQTVVMHQKVQNATQ